MAQPLITGVHYKGTYEGCFDSDTSDQLVSWMQKSTRASWICLNCAWSQKDIHSTTIVYPSPYGPTLIDIKHATRYAKSLGLKVALKMNITLGCDDNGKHTTADIGSTFTEDQQWQYWFESYTQYAKLMARSAEEYGIDMIIIGSNLGATEHREEDWKRLIARCRKQYTGSLVYGASSQKLVSAWPVGHALTASTAAAVVVDLPSWQTNDLDYIGIDGYVPLSTTPGVVPVKSLAQVWAVWAQLMAQISCRYKKKILITEIGYCSREDAAVHPRHSTGLLSIPVQTNCYAAAVTTLYCASNKAWLAGTLWWNWSSNYKKNGDTDPGYNPANKPACNILHAAHSLPLVDRV